MPDLRLAIPAAALWLCCGIGIGVPAAMPVLAGCAAALAVVVLVVAAGAASGRSGRSVHRRARSSPSGASGAAGETRRVRPVRYGATSAIALAASALGATAIGVQGPQRIDAVLEAAAEDHTRVDVAVRIESAPRRAAAGFDGIERWRLRGTTVMLGRPDAASSGEHSDDRVVGDGVPVALAVPGDRRSVREYALGAVVSADVSVRPNDPGEATTFTLHALARPTLLDGAPPWLAWAATLRGAFAEAAAATPGDGGDLLPGLAIGDETAVGSDLDEAMKASSLSHLTAVSGANCALVTGLVFLLARALGLGRHARIAAAAAALAAFVILVGPGASVLRAAAMAAVVLIGLARGRVAGGLPALSLAVILLLVHDPWLARDYGFALSALATAGLLLLARPLTALLARWLPRGVAVALAVPLAAQLACQPVLILLTPSLPLWGVPANLVAEPAAPVATVIGCLACVLLPWAPMIGQAAVWVAWLPSAWISLVARFAAALPGAALPWPDGVAGVVLCALALVAVGLVVSRRALPRVIGSSAALVLAAGVLVYAGSLGGREFGRALGRPGDWVIAACDVGQGDALVVRDGPRVALIDVGRRPGPLESCLDTLGIARLDWVLLTHYDADHAGGVDAVLRRTDRVIVGEPDRAADHRLLQRLAAAGLSVERGRAGMAGELGAIAWQIVWPPRAEPGGTQLTGNAGSLVVRTEGRAFRALFLGDLGENEQEALRRSGGARPVDVVKVSHHGSADQSARLYAELHAGLGLVSVGAENGYGHPTRQALSLLRAAGTAVARTDEWGLLLVSPASTGPSLWVERPAPVSAQGASTERAGAPTNGAASERAGGRLYPGYGRGGTWRHEATPGAVRADVPAVRQRRARSRNCRGTRSGPLRWCWSPARRASSPIGPHGCCATSSSRRTRASRSATSRPRTTRRESCSRSRAPPCSANRG